MIEKLENYITIERLKPYLTATNDNYDMAMELYDWNIRLSESLYSSLCYFEIILRNVCNNELIKELGEYWFDNKKLLLGNSPEKGKSGINKILEAKNKLINVKEQQKITNGDVISNLQFGFWVNLFCANYESTIWKPYLKYIFINYKRDDIYKLFDNIRKLRNRVFHYEPIIFKFDLEYKYKRIIETKEFLSNIGMFEKVKKVSRFEELFNEYSEYKNDSGGSPNQLKSSMM